MMIDVYVTGGSVFRLCSRTQLVELISRDLLHVGERRGVNAWIDRGIGESFTPIRLLYLRRGHVERVERVELDVRDAWLAEHDPATLAAVRAKELTGLEAVSEADAA